MLETKTFVYVLQTSRERLFSQFKTLKKTMLLNSKLATHKIILVFKSDFTVKRHKLTLKKTLTLTIETVWPPFMVTKRLKMEIENFIPRSAKE